MYTHIHIHQKKTSGVMEMQVVCMIVHCSVVGKSYQNRCDTYTKHLNTAQQFVCLEISNSCLNWFLPVLMTMIILNPCDSTLPSQGLWLCGCPLARRTAVDICLCQDSAAPEAHTHAHKKYIYIYLKVHPVSLAHNTLDTLDR